MNNKDANQFTREMVPEQKQYNNMKELISFCNNHQEIYIYGCGELGAAVKHFLTQCGVTVAGYVVTSPATGADSDIQIISASEFKNLYFTNKAGLIFGLSADYYHEIIPFLREFIDIQDIFIVSEFNKQIMAAALRLNNLNLTIKLTYSCNNSCAYCGSFSPLAKKKFIDINDFRRDLCSVQPLFQSHNGEKLFSRISFSGGESFLHPRFCEFIEAAREFLPGVTIEFFTNGIVLPTFDEALIARLGRLNIAIVLTEYPIKNLDLSGYYALAERYSLKTIGLTAEETKYFVKMPLVLNKSNLKYEYILCHYFWNKGCICLEDGKLWRCGPIPASKIFNEYFDTLLEISPDDYVDIHTAGRDEIIDYLKKRPPFCGHCNISERRTYPWKISSKKIDEWT